MPFGLFDRRYRNTDQQTRPRIGEDGRVYHDRPPAYTSKFYENDPVIVTSRWSPRTWPRRCWIFLVIALIVLIIIIVAVAVIIVRENRYPNYSALNYTLVDTFAGTSFFENFDYFTGYDPSEGFVHYVDGPGSIALNLTYASSTSAILRVDTSTTDTTTGRKSVRIESKNTYDTGLFIFDILHTPYQCSVWPALWLTDPSNWPANGEIDVMEAVNTATSGNQMTLHTTNGCNMKSVKRKEIGNVLNTNCYNGTNDNAGCGVQGPTTGFGESFNSNGGGVYAMELRSAGIRAWFFDRNNIPSDITTSTSDTADGGLPDPASWGEALADFPNTDCDISQHFRNLTIIANIDLCGSWAGLEQYYSAEAGCPGTCVEYVSQQPGSAYENAYWEFGSFRVYQAS